MVSGLTGIVSDEEVSTFLQKYGNINHLCIDDPNSDFHKHMIIKFTYGSTLQTLEPLLPLKLHSSSHTGTMCEIKGLGSVYTLNA